MGAPPPPPPEPAAPPPRPGRRLTLGPRWTLAARAAVLAAAGTLLLAEAVVFAVGFAGRRTASAANVARAGAVLFFWFHHAGVVFVPSRGVAPGVTASFTLSLAPMLGTGV